MPGPKRNQPHICGADFFLESGNVLLSRAFFPMLYRPGELAQSRPFGRSLRFPTLRLAVSPTGRARLRSHRARMGKNLAKSTAALTRRWPGSSSLPGVFPHAVSIRGTRTVAALWPLLAIPDASPACFRHWRRQAPVPQGAHGEKPSQVQCRTHPHTARKQLSPGRFSPCCIDPGNSHSRGPLAAPCDSRRIACLFPPLAAAGSGPTGRARLET